jgi:hypothetical protein
MLVQHRGSKLLTAEPNTGLDPMPLPFSSYPYTLLPLHHLILPCGHVPRPSPPDFYMNSEHKPHIQPILPTNTNTVIMPGDIKLTMSLIM